MTDEAAAHETTVAIKPLMAADFPSWELLWSGYLDFYRATVAPEVTRATFERLVSAEAPELCGLGALLDGELVGIAHLVFHPSTWRSAHDCYLEDLFVGPEARRQGVARRLLETVIELASERRAERLYWLTQDSNETARLLYDQLAEVAPFVLYERSLV